MKKNGICEPISHLLPCNLYGCKSLAVFISEYILLTPWSTKIVKQQGKVNLDPPWETDTVQTWVSLLLPLCFYQYAYLAHPWHPVVGSSIVVCPGGNLPRGTRHMLTVPNYEKRERAGFMNVK